MKRTIILLATLFFTPLHLPLLGWVGITHKQITKKSFKLARQLTITSTTHKQISAIAYHNLMTDFRNDLRMSYYKRYGKHFKKRYSRSFEFIINGRRRVFNHFSSLQHFYDPYKKSGFCFKDIKTPFYKKGVAHISRKRGATRPFSPLLKPSNQYETTIIFPSGKKTLLLKATFLSARAMMNREYKKLINKNGNKNRQLGAIFHLFQDVTVPYHTLNTLGSLQLGSAKWVSHANYIVRAMRYCSRYGLNIKITKSYYKIYWKKFLAMRQNIDTFFHYIAMETASSRNSYKTNLHRCAGMTMVLIRHLRRYL